MGLGISYSMCLYHMTGQPREIQLSICVKKKKKEKKTLGCFFKIRKTAQIRPALELQRKKMLDVHKEC